MKPGQVPFASGGCFGTLKTMAQALQQVAWDPRVHAHALESMGSLADGLRTIGYSGDELRLVVMRVLFVLYADTQGLWSTNLVATSIEKHTGDLGNWLHALFVALGTPRSKRAQARLFEGFPQVKGGLFDGRRNSQREATREELGRLLERHLRKALRVDWAQVSPLIFATVFQASLETHSKRTQGTHYTSMINIMKVLAPLFLDDLWSRLQRCASVNQLRQLLTRVHQLRLLDPACGCGNFLVVASCQLVRIERAILQQLARHGSWEHPGRVGPHQFYGIEQNPLAAAIARTVLGLPFSRLGQPGTRPDEATLAEPPRNQGPTIQVGNALRMQWQDVLPPSQCSFICGNPPFVGKKERSPGQKQDMLRVFGKKPGIGVLDYVTCWFHKATHYMAGTRVEAAFVSTNSITHGEQPPVLWEALGSPPPSIRFAHRTFNWSSEARGAAHVHCVIIGFCLASPPGKRVLFDYKDIDGHPDELSATNINAYLTDGPSVLITKRRKPLVAGIRAAREGNKLGDWGHLTVGPDEIDEVRADPVASCYVRRLVGASEMLNGIDRWCLWLGDITPIKARSSPWLSNRLRAVQAARLASTKNSTRAMASRPQRFLELRQPSERYLMIPCVSSSRRRHIPMRFYEPTTILRTPSSAIAGATLVEFGLLHSAMFMAWVRAVSGRLKSDYQVAPGTVYNTFPFPLLSLEQRLQIEVASQRILDARAGYPKATLAELYDPTAMPAHLAGAHEKLDLVVDRAFGVASAAQRLPVLFARYEALTRVT